MIKLFIIFLSLFILNGCEKEMSELTKIILNDNLTLEYAEEASLFDLVKVNEGKIISDDFDINTMVLGKQNIKFKFKDANGNKFTHEFNINVVDTTKPLILASSYYTVEINSEDSLPSYPLCADNYDKSIKCNIEGDYDLNTLGSYNLKYTAIDTNNNYSEHSFTLEVKNPTYEEDFYEEEVINIKDFTKKYKNENTLIGIDVSSWQDDIDYELVKRQGIEFVMIRIGFGHNNEGEIVLDSWYENNIKKAKEAGLKVGIYFYSYASNENEATAQAKWILKILNKEKLDLPIAFDWEDWSDFENYNMSLVDINNVAKAFLKTIEKKGYKAMNYGSALYLKYIWNLNNYDTWLAHYTEMTDYSGDYYIWQVTNSGQVDGINGYVDLNVLYKK
ncbi:MAG: glycoside hydrolase family 25 protein [Bacilli bacterium]|nr:glycoside hydrolase family 25 protein [Bacilli bacterium]